MEELSRRTFFGMGLGTLMVGAAGRAIADEGIEDNVEFRADVTIRNTDEGSWSEPASSEELDPNLIDRLRLAELRKQLVDSKEEYTREDGTVVPAVYTKLRALINSYGQGIGSDVTDRSFDFFMNNWTEEEAQLMLDMPWDRFFTEAELLETTEGKSEDELHEMCEKLSMAGLIHRVYRSGVIYYHVAADAQGYFEATCFRYDEDFLTDRINQFGTDADGRRYNAGTPLLRVLPVSEDVVEGGVLPFDSWRKVIERNTIIAISPCQCRTMENIMGTRSEECEHPLETCMTFGEEAEFYLAIGNGRQLTQEEAVEIMERNIDAGLVTETAYSKNCEVICCCHSDCCGILGAYVALNGEGNALPQASHYLIDVDYDACLSCGACAERCPMRTITMDEDNRPVVGNTCVSCGQCAVVCPAGARTLKHKESVPELPQGMYDDHDLKAQFRFNRGAIY